MVSKLANTQQKMRVLESSGREDVLEFLGIERASSKSKEKRRNSGSKSKFSSKLRNIHAIDGELKIEMKPQSQSTRRRINHPPM